MNREIKFRGKRLDNGEWVVGDLIENQGRFFIYHATSETTIEDDDDGRISIVAVEVAPATVGQYTGLKDKNGKKIYEGDVVKWNDKYPPKVILWFVCQFDAGNDSCSMPLLALKDKCPIEIIGNIHDNPELLK